ncbi:MAG: hypothetical protein ABIO55_04055 [Ginsengibacter sp.]
MKPVINIKTVINKAKLVATASVLVFTMASAQSQYNTDEIPVEFKYIGTTYNQPVFQLNLHNSEADEFVITLRNSTGDVLYSEKVAGKEIIRKYRLDTGVIDASKITVEVNSIKNHNKSVYAVNRTTRVVEDVVVTKL